MTSALDPLAARVAELPRSGRGRRYPAGLRHEIVTAATDARALGVSVARIQEHLGVSWNTITRWQRSMSSPSLLPVLVRDTAPPPSVPVVISPSGWRGEGRTLADVRTLLESA